MKRSLIEAAHPELSIVAQCELISLPRSSYYYTPCSESEENLALMRRIDEQWLETPFYGVRRMHAQLRREEYAVNIKRVRRLMRLMGLVALGPQPSPPGGGKAHKRYPYLLRDRVVKAPNEVWCADITYLPMARGFLYLVAIMDWHSRAVLAWELSNSLEVRFCVSALENAVKKYGKPLIFNTDQGAQFNAKEWICWLERKKIQISQDGKGRATDNAFIERLWRSLKYEYIYLHTFADGLELFHGLKEYFHFYNYQRVHQGLKYQCPMEVYRKINYPSNSNHQPKSSLADIA